MGSCCSSQADLESATMENTEEFCLSGRKMYAKVLSVYDGDTMTIAFDFQGKLYHKSCRVDGVNCPEIRTRDEHEKKMGLKAKEFVTNMILNKIVWTEFSMKNDKYGRLLAKIYPEKNKDSLDLILIREGLGNEYHGGSKN